MPTEQENYRLQRADEQFSNAGRLSKRLKEQMDSALQLYKRDETIINGVLTDGNLTDADYLHNGGSSPTIGEFKQALRAVLSYAAHTGEMTTQEAETMMSDAGIADNTVLATQDIAKKLEPIRV